MRLSRAESLGPRSIGIAEVSAGALKTPAAGITAEILHVEAGMHAVVGGMAGLGGE